MSKQNKAIADGEQTATVVLGNPDKIQEYLQSRSQPRAEVIRQATIVDGYKLKVQWTIEVDNGVDTITKKCSTPVHDDLRNAFARLRDHLGRLCFQPLTEHNPAYKEDKTQPQLICPITVTGFKISGNDETEGVTIFGSRTLPNAKNIDLQSPVQKWNGDVYDYEESDDLSEIIAACVGEVELYLFEGKHQPDKQMSLFDQEEEDQKTEE